MTVASTGVRSARGRRLAVGAVEGGRHVTTAATRSRSTRRTGPSSGSSGGCASAASSRRVARSLVADLYLGYGLSSTIRRHALARSARAVPAAARCLLPSGPRAMLSTMTMTGAIEAAGLADSFASAPGGGPGPLATTPPPSSASAMRSRAATCTRSTSCSTWQQTFAGDPGTLAARLATLNPHNREPYRGDGWSVVSGSPELFLARRGRRVWTCPIKGTRPAGAGAARELARSAKDAAEHVMIVDLERNDLSRVCEPGSVRWPELMATRALAGVEHMVSTVEGTLRDGVGLAELLAATFPGGSITGAPKIAAVDLIAEIEPVGRGASMGALGSRLRQRRPRSRADDPDVRDRGRADPPLGRRRRRLGLGSAGGDRRVVGQGGSAAARDRRAPGRARRAAGRPCDRARCGAR